ncbi:hypothetical protein [Prochlorococcus marinus]|uniref:hypothetical protein n=1 Tax=Prochlorococcus marinus TaxID=1219 RepID=UPI001ADBC130|nr:hypothetical protein [Prochlorococcus marinus]MBO8221439.1 hypothetical protein [Prochlorococcus marinus CUG1417]MBW3074249.1 hypothetical protein [Prochlorococcus marinus str. MU1417]
MISKLKFHLKKCFQYIRNNKNIDSFIKNLDVNNLNIVLTSDCDHATLKRHKSIIQPLCSNGIKITVATFLCLEDDKSPLAKHCYKNETTALDNKEFREFLLNMRDKYGLEIAYHGFSQISNKRIIFEKGLKLFREYTGEMPYTYVEHGGLKNHHIDGMCKKETLAFEGKNISSDYYILDILRENIKAVWAEHDYLDQNKENYLLEDFFYIKDGLNRFKRHKASMLSNQISRASNNSYFFPYTHFNYDLFDINVGNILERWDIYSRSKAFEFLYKLKDNGANFLTVKDAHKLWLSK